MAWAHDSAPSASSRARALAHDHVASRRPGERRGFDPLLRGVAADLEEAYTALVDPDRAREADGRFVEWMLDNEYVVRGAIASTREVLTRAFHRDLPKLPTDGATRILAVARALLEASDQQISIEWLERFLHEYQQVRTLTIGEVWALPAALRLAILEDLAVVARRALEVPASRTTGPPSWVTIANQIGSLRLLEGHDWRVFFERVSAVEATLREDPSGHYPRMDFDSRDRYRKAVERIARWAGADETAVAVAAVRACRDGSSGDDRACHVGFFLMGAGRRDFEASLGAKPRGRPARDRWIRRRATGLYFGAIGAIGAVLLVSLTAAMGGGGGVGIMLALAVGWIPALTVAGSAVNWVVSHLLSPEPLAKLALEGTVPEELATVVAIPAVIGDESTVDALLGRLEILPQATSLAGLRFVLLTDFADAPSQRRPTDDDLLRRVRRGIGRLNERDRSEVPRFGLLHRARRLNGPEGCWMGWERKRGKLHELNRLILGDAEGRFDVVEGAARDLADVRFVITLDADTGLPRGAAERMIGALAHPLNRPRTDREGRVVEGYTVLQPRVETLPDPDERTWFGRLGATGSGLDLYAHAISDAYQDLFGEGIYAGKGIYDVAAFEAALEGRVPDNALLSHDLFEGVHGRAGLLSDTTLLEEFPGHILAYTRRLHRWIRGDWQIAPWLLPRVPSSRGPIPNPLSALSRWKIFDNLRRSLLAPGLIVLLVGAWTLRAGPAWASVLALAIVLGFPAFLGAATATRRVVHEARARSGRHSLHLTRGTIARFGERVARWILAIVLLPFEAVVAIGAIGRTLWRLLVSRRHLLQWTAHAAMVRALRDVEGSAAYWRGMREAPLLAAVLAAVVSLTGGGAVTTWVLIAVWAASPQIGYWISRPLPSRRPRPTPDAERFLRQLALRTWLYFERCVTADDHWLPPDNWQEDRTPRLARRTSPTNIGMLFTSMVAAYDLGYLTAPDLEAMVGDTLDAVERLPRFRGHLLNWYSTEDLSPLEPRYVSSVDSGNLAVSLLLLRHALEQAAAGALFRPADGEGLGDLFTLLEETIAETGPAPTASAELRRSLERVAATCRAMPTGPAGRRAALLELEREILPDLEERTVAVAEAPGVGAPAVARIRESLVRVHEQVVRDREEIDRLMPWVAASGDLPSALADTPADGPLGRALAALRAALDASPVLREIADQADRVRAACGGVRTAASGASLAPEALESIDAWCGWVEYALKTGVRRASRLVTDLRGLAARAGALAEGMDFRFLFDPARQLLHIGYNASDEELDPHYYDLLASEARLASYFAIAKGDVPVAHWLRLGRAFTLAGRSPVLLSWSATMFEYLLPTLFLPSPEGSLLDHSCAQAVKGQIEFGRRHDIPWGMSESAYERTSGEASYRYRAFGVPGFGLRRQPGDRRVVAPYASALALRYDPAAAVENLERLRAVGLGSAMGLHEAIDYGTGRARSGRPVIVRALMAHHQGMILAAIDNLLNDDILVRRLGDDPALAALEYLLHERLPWRVPLETRPLVERIAASARAVLPAAAGVPVQPWIPRGDERVPQVHALTNGRIRTLLTARGAGGSRMADLALTRWRPDPTRERLGSWIYLRDQDTGSFWSATAGPTGPREPGSTVHFWPHMAEFHEQRHQISSRLRVTVAPDDDVEVRILTISNDGDRTRRLAVTSYEEVVLGDPQEDMRHPAYSEMFLEAERVEEPGCLVYRRRPRSSAEPGVCRATALFLDGGTPEATGWEVDRERFLGRGGNPEAPAALVRGEIGGDARPGAPLHPVAVSSLEFEVAPYSTREVIAVAAVGEDRESAVRLVREYRSHARAAWAFERARQEAEIELQDLGCGSEDLGEFERIASVALHPVPELRAAAAVRRAGRPQPELWRFGLSGDVPIVLLRTHGPGAIGPARRLLAAHAFWRRRGFEIDLVILDSESAGYAQPLRDALGAEIERGEAGDWLGRRGGIHLLSTEAGDAEGHRAVEAAAAVLFDSTDGPISERLARAGRPARRMPAFVPVPTAPPGSQPTLPLERPGDLRYDNGLGGFSPDGREYVIHLEPERTTPAPWANIVALPQVGCLCTEAGLGYTWEANAGENRLTPWRGDPVGDAPAEAIYLRDEETAEVWTPTPRPAGTDAACRIRHGVGYTIYRSDRNGLEQRIRVFCDPAEPAKLVQVRLRNLWPHTRRITVTYYAEWVLGSDRSRSLSRIVTDYEAEARALLARNPFSADFGRRVAFLTASEPPHGLTADRREFLGRDGSYARPDALRRIGLSGRVGDAADPCAAYQVHLDIGPGERKEFHFALGQGEDREDAVRLARTLGRTTTATRAWRKLHRFWEARLGAVRVRTPDPAFDLMMNRWLPYQVRASRLWGRTGFYQSSGAFGFRDQLQDVLALLDSEPRVARDHILRAARHQFAAGDVLHWWHPVTQAGVRTRCSDDLAWLPYVTARYVARTGDHGILEEREPFLAGASLAPEEHDRYARFEATGGTGTLYEHCLRALDRAATMGPRGLPLIGTGDWNDGLDRVGIGGRGESVWLGWFLVSVLRAFAPLCERRGDGGRAIELERVAAMYAERLEAEAWDGEWYRRAYYDDGTPLGSREGAEARIDAVSQAWAVISGASAGDRQRSAMDAVHRLLRDEDDALLRLLDPPFDRTPEDPGYIKGYPPGVRENGSQYSHAAVWVGWAHALLGDTDRAYEIFRFVSPVERGGDPGRSRTYRVEPYVVAADIYSGDRHGGRGGWTWYTGSAAWLYRLGLEVILGIEREGSRIRVTPRIPASWEGYDVRLDVDGEPHLIRVVADPETGEHAVSMEDESAPPPGLVRDS